MLEKAGNWLRKKVDSMFNYPVVLATEDYDPESDFLWTFQQNLRDGVENIDSRLGYVLVAIDATPRQLGFYDENTSETFFEHVNLDEYVRIFLSMTQAQADAVMNIRTTMNLETFSLIFAGIMSTDITAKPDPNARISIPEYNDSNDLVDVLIVSLHEFCPYDVTVSDWTEMTERAAELVMSGNGERYSDTVKQKIDYATNDSDDNGDEATVSDSSTSSESRRSFSTRNTSDKNDGPYSDEALQRMFEQVTHDEKVDDSAVDFIIAMLDKMTEDQKINVIDTISKNWVSIVGPKATSMLMSLTDVASDIPNAVKTYKDSLDKIFPPGEISEEAKAQMLVHFHAGLVQKII